MRKYTQRELDNIQLAIDAGWHLVPYNRTKTPPKFFSWSNGGIKVESADEAQLFTQYCDENSDHGYLMGFVLSSADALLVDIDLPLPLLPEEADGLEIDEHKDKVKAVWKSWKPDDQKYLLDGYRKLAVGAGLEPHNYMYSTSGTGAHYYYKCKSRKTGDRLVNYLTKISKQDKCIEIFANKRLAYVTDWADMDRLINAIPVPYEKVVGYWSPVADKTNGYRQLAKEAEAIPTPPLQCHDGQYTTNYEQYVAASPYASQSKSCRLFVWLVKAYQLDDMEGEQAGLMDARSLGLSEAKIAKQRNGARAFARTHPDNQLRTMKTMVSTRIDL